MDFLFDTYSDVSTWDLAIGWILAFHLLLAVAFLIEKVFSLSRQLSKFKDRPRGKSGRFLRGGK